MANSPDLLKAKYLQKKATLDAKYGIKPVVNNRHGSVAMLSNEEQAKLTYGEKTLAQLEAIREADANPTLGDKFSDLPVAAMSGAAGALNNFGQVAGTVNAAMMTPVDWVVSKINGSQPQTFSDMLSARTDALHNVTAPISDSAQKEYSHVHQAALAEKAEIENSDLPEETKMLATLDWYKNHLGATGIMTAENLTRQLIETAAYSKFLPASMNTKAKVFATTMPQEFAGFVDENRQKGGQLDAQALRLGLGVAAGNAMVEMLGGGKKMDMESIMLDGKKYAGSGLDFIKANLGEMGTEFIQGTTTRMATNINNDIEATHNQGPGMIDDMVMGSTNHAVMTAPHITSKAALAVGSSQLAGKLDEAIKDKVDPYTFKTHADPANEKYDPVRAYNKSVNSTDKAMNSQADDVIVKASNHLFELKEKVKGAQTQEEKAIAASELIQFTKAYWLPLLDAQSAHQKAQDSVNPIYNGDEFVKATQDLMTGDLTKEPSQTIGDVIVQGKQTAFANTTGTPSSDNIGKLGRVAIIGKDAKINSNFGMRTHPITGEKKGHSGIDINAPVGTSIYAPTDAKVIDVYENAEGGKQVRIQLADGHILGFAHLSASNVKVGDVVRANTVIAVSGNTGKSTGAHIHFTVRNPKGEYVNPETYQIGSVSAKPAAPAQGDPRTWVTNGQPSGKTYQTISNSKGNGFDNNKDMITESAQAVGIDPRFLFAMGGPESGYVTNADNPLPGQSASGLFQFIDSTWNSMKSKYGQLYGIPANASQHDPKANAILGALYVKEHIENIRKNGREVTPTDVYMNHFLGHGGYNKFVKALENNPNAPVSTFMSPKQVNDNGQYTKNKDGSVKTVQQMYGSLTNAINKHAGASGATTVTAAATQAEDSQEGTSFLDRWRKRNTEEESQQPQAETPATETQAESTDTTTDEQKQVAKEAEDNIQILDENHINQLEQIGAITSESAAELRRIKGIKQAVQQNTQLTDMKSVITQPIASVQYEDTAQATAPKEKRKPIIIQAQAENPNSPVKSSLGILAQLDHLERSGILTAEEANNLRTLSDVNQQHAGTRNIKTTNSDIMTGFKGANNESSFMGVLQYNQQLVPAIENNDTETVSALMRNLSNFTEGHRSKANAINEAVSYQRTDPKADVWVVPQVTKNSNGDSRVEWVVKEGKPTKEERNKFAKAGAISLPGARKLQNMVNNEADILDNLVSGYNNHIADLQRQGKLSANNTGNQTPIKPTPTPTGSTTTTAPNTDRIVTINDANMEAPKDGIWVGRSLGRNDANGKPLRFNLADTASKAVQGGANLVAGLSGWLSNPFSVNGKKGFKTKDQTESVNKYVELFNRTFNTNDEFAQNILNQRGQRIYTDSIHQNEATFLDHVINNMPEAASKDITKAREWLNSQAVKIQADNKGKIKAITFEATTPIPIKVGPTPESLLADGYTENTKQGSQSRSFTKTDGDTTTNIAFGASGTLHEQTITKTKDGERKVRKVDGEVTTDTTTKVVENTIKDENGVPLTYRVVRDTDTGKIVEVRVAMAAHSNHLNEHGKYNTSKDLGVIDDAALDKFLQDQYDSFSIETKDNTVEYQAELSKVVQDPNSPQGQQAIIDKAPKHIQPELKSLVKQGYVLSETKRSIVATSPEFKESGYPATRIIKFKNDTGDKTFDKTKVLVATTPEKGDIPFSVEFSYDNKTGKWDSAIKLIFDDGNKSLINDTVPSSMSKLPLTGVITLLDTVYNFKVKPKLSLTELLKLLPQYVSIPLNKLTSFDLNSLGISLNWAQIEKADTMEDNRTFIGIITQQIEKAIIGGFSAEVAVQNILQEVKNEGLVINEESLEALSEYVKAKIQHDIANTTKGTTTTITNPDNSDQFHSIPTKLLDTVNRAADVLEELKKVRSHHTDESKAAQQIALLEQMVKDNPNVDIVFLHEDPVLAKQAMDILGEPIAEVSGFCSTNHTTGLSTIYLNTLNVEDSATFKGSDILTTLVHEYTHANTQPSLKLWIDDYTANEANLHLGLEALVVAAQNIKENLKNIRDEQEAKGNTYFVHYWDYMLQLPNVTEVMSVALSEPQIIDALSKEVLSETAVAYFTDLGIGLDTSNVHALLSSIYSYTNQQAKDNNLLIKDADYANHTQSSYKYKGPSEGNGTADGNKTSDTGSGGQDTSDSEGQTEGSIVDGKFVFAEAISAELSKQLDDFYKQGYVATSINPFSVGLELSTDNEFYTVGINRENATIAYHTKDSLSEETFTDEQGDTYHVRISRDLDNNNEVYNVYAIEQGNAAQWLVRGAGEYIEFEDIDNLTDQEIFNKVKDLYVPVVIEEISEPVKPTELFSTVSEYDFNTTQLDPNSIYVVEDTSKAKDESNVISLTDTGLTLHTIDTQGVLKTPNTLENIPLNELTPTQLMHKRNRETADIQDMTNTIQNLLFLDEPMATTLEKLHALYPGFPTLKLRNIVEAVKVTTQESMSDYLARNAQEVDDLMGLLDRVQDNLALVEEVKAIITERVKAIKAQSADKNVVFVVNAAGQFASSLKDSSPDLYKWVRNLINKELKFDIDSKTNTQIRATQSEAVPERMGVRHIEEVPVIQGPEQITEMGNNEVPATMLDTPIGVFDFIKNLSKVSTKLSDNHKKVILAIVKSVANYMPDVKVVIQSNQKGMSRYDAETKTIHIVPQGFASIHELFARLLVQASNAWLVENIADLSLDDKPELHKLNHEINGIRSELSTLVDTMDNEGTLPENVKGVIYYALASNSNLLSVGLTNPVLMQFLQNNRSETKVGKPTNIFKRIVKSVATFFGISKDDSTASFYERLLQASSQATEIQNKGTKQSFKTSKEAIVGALRGITDEDIAAEREKPLKKQNKFILSFQQKQKNALARIPALAKLLRTDREQALSNLYEGEVSAVQSRQLDDFLAFKEEFTNYLVASFRNRTPSEEAELRRDDLKGFMVEDQNGNLTVDDNVITALSLAAYGWVLEKSHKDRNTLDDIKIMLNVDDSASDMVIQSKIDDYQFIGASLNNVINGLGKNFLSTLNITGREDASIYAEAQLAMSVGNWIISAMQMAGLVHIHSMPTATHMQNIIDVGGTNPFETTPGPHVQSYFVSVTDKEGKGKNPRLGQISEMSKGTKGFLSDLFGVQVGLRMPSVTAPKEVNLKIKRSKATVSQFQEDGLKVMQMGEYKINEDMFDLINDLYQSDSDFLLDLLDARVTQEELNRLHITERKGKENSSEGNLRDLLNAFDWIAGLDRSDDTGFQVFYDSVDTARNSRMHQRSNMFNMQGSTLHRAMANYSSDEIEIDTTSLDINNVLGEDGKPSIATLFLRGIAENAEGTKKIMQAMIDPNKEVFEEFTVDKMSSPVFIPAFFEYLMTDPDVLAATSAMINLRAGMKLSTEDKAAIAKVVSLWDMKGQSIRALLEWSKFYEAYSEGLPLKTSLTLGSDGVNNGTAISAPQNGVVTSPEFLYQVGVIPEVPSQPEYADINSYFDVRQFKSIGDYYTGFKNMLNEALTTEFKLNDPHVRAIQALNPSLLERKTAKDALVPYGYTAGMSRIKQVVFERFLSDIKEQMVKFAHMSDEEIANKANEYYAFQENIAYLLNKDVMDLGMPAIEDRQKLLTAWFAPGELKQLEVVYNLNIGQVIADTMVQYTGELTNRREQLISMHNATLEIFIAARNTLIEQAENTVIERHGKEKFDAEYMTKQEWDELVESQLEPVRAMIANAFSFRDPEDERRSDTDLFEITKELSSDNGKISGRTRETTYDDFNQVTYVDNRSRGLPFEVSNVESAGLFPASALVQSADAFIALLATTIDNIVSLNVHDSGSAALTHYFKMVDAQNKGYYQVLSEFHVHLESMKSLVRVISGFHSMKEAGLISEELFNEIMANKVMKSLYKNDAKLEAMFNDRASFSTMIAYMIDRAQKIENEKFNILAGMKVIHQYAGEGGEHVVTAEEKAHAEDQRALVTETFQELLNKVTEMFGEAALVKARPTNKVMGKARPTQQDWVFIRDQQRSLKSDKIIAFGKKGSEPKVYAEYWGNDANTSSYKAGEVVSIFMMGGDEASRYGIDSKNLAEQLALATNAKVIFLLNDSSSRNFVNQKGQQWSFEEARLANRLVGLYGYTELNYKNHKGDVVGSGVFVPNGSNYSYEFLNHLVPSTRVPVPVYQSTEQDSNTINIWSTVDNGYNTLSNLAPSTFSYQGREYVSVEHAYQSLKSGEFDESTYKQERWKKGWQKISGKDSGGIDEAKRNLMHDLLVASFTQDLVRQQLLLSTSNKELTHQRPDRSEDPWEKVFPEILMKVRSEVRAENQNKDTKPTTMEEITNHSGGANGADITWDQIGQTHGVANHVHYFLGTRNNNNAPHGNTPVSEKDVDEGKVTAARAGNQLYGFNGKTMSDTRLIRNWSQVKYSDSVFAVSRLGLKGELWRSDMNLQTGKPNKANPRYLAKDTVQGGTGYAVEMAIMLDKPVYVYNMEANSKYPEGWYTYKDGEWLAMTTTPTLTKNFAGIGSRELTENGLRAIDNVYQATKQNLKPKYELKAPHYATKLTEITFLGMPTKGHKITFAEYPEAEIYLVKQGSTILAVFPIVDKSINLKVGTFTDARERIVILLNHNANISAENLATLQSVGLFTDEVLPTTPTALTAEDIYSQLGNKTESEHVVIKPVYQRAGVAYAKSIGGVFSMRVNDMKMHFGNPYSHVPKEIAKGLIATKDTKESVVKYIDWVINSSDERAAWIREQLKSGVLKGRKIVYYQALKDKNGNPEPSHATALDYLINKYDWTSNKAIIKPASTNTSTISKETVIKNLNEVDGGNNHHVINEIKNAFNQIKDWTDQYNEAESELLNLLVNKLIAVNPKVKIEVVESIDSSSSSTMGRYFPENNAIQVLKNYTNHQGHGFNALNTLNHELAHALSHDNLRNPKFAKEVAILEKVAKQLVDARWSYAARNSLTEFDKYLINYADNVHDEIISLYFNVPEFRKLIDQYVDFNKIPEAREYVVKAGVLSVLKQVFMKLIGLENSQSANVMQDIIDKVTSNDLQKSVNKSKVPFKIEVTPDIARSSVPSTQAVNNMSAMDVLHQLDKGNISNEHNELLDSMIDNIIGDFYQHTPNGKQKVDKTIATIKSKAVIAGFNLSDKEAMVNEILLAVFSAHINSHSGESVINEYRKMYNEITDKDAKNKLTVEDLNPNYKNLTKAQQKIVQSQLAYLTSATKGNKQGEFLPRFLALTIASQDFYNVMDKTRERVRKQPKTIAEKMISFVQKVVDWLVGAMLRNNTKDTVSEQIVNLVDTLRRIDINSRNSTQSKLRDTWYSSQTYTKKLNDAVNKGFRKAAKLAGKISNNSTFKDAAHLAEVVTASDADVVGKATFIAQQRVFNKNGRLTEFGELINDILAQTNLQNVVEKLLRLTQLAGKYRDEAKVATIKLLKQGFTRDLTKSERAAITNALARTDMSALLEYMNISQVMSLITNKTAREKMIAKLETEILQGVNGKDVLFQTKTLAAYMLGDTPENLLKNVDSIASHFGTKYRTKTVDPVLRQKVDILASLYAYEDSSSQDKAVIESLIKDEANGIKLILRTHKTLADEAKKDFIGNMYNYEKGYLPEINDPYKSIKYAESWQEVKDLEGKGWILLTPQELDQDSSDLTSSRVMMYHPNFDYVDYRSGAVDLKDTHSRGTVVYTTKDNFLDVNRVANDMVARRNLRNQGKFEDFDPSKTSGSLIVTYNADGTIKNYHYEMTGDVRNRLLNRNNDIFDLLGALHASNVYKPMVRAQQRKAAEILEQDYSENNKAHAADYIWLDPESEDPKIVEQWRMLPHPFRERAAELFGRGNPIPVRNLIYNSMFGYRVYSLAEMFDKASGERNLLERIIVGLFTMGKEKNHYKARNTIRNVEQVIQYVMKNIKETIVLRGYKVLMGNMIANTLLLTLHGVYPADIIKGYRMAWFEGRKFTQYSARLAEIKLELQANAKDKNKVRDLNRELMQINDALEKSPMLKYMKAGLMSTIVEDVGLSKENTIYQNKFEDSVDEVLDKIPEPIVNTLKFVAMARGTALYEFMADATQYSDFGAKFILAKHLQERKGMSFDKAITEAQKNFINFDTPLGRGIDYLNTIGLLMFSKFAIRFQKVIFERFKKQPATLIMQTMLMEGLLNQPSVPEPSMLNGFPENPFSPSVLTVFGMQDDLMTTDAIMGTFNVMT